MSPPTLRRLPPCLPSAGAILDAVAERGREALLRGNRVMEGGRVRQITFVAILPQRIRMGNDCLFPPSPLWMFISGIHSAKRSPFASFLGKKGWVLLQRFAHNMFQAPSNWELHGIISAVRYFRRRLTRRIEVVANGRLVARSPSLPLWPLSEKPSQYEITRPGVGQAST